MFSIEIYSTQTRTGIKFCRFRLNATLTLKRFSSTGKALLFLHGVFISVRRIILWVLSDTRRKRRPPRMRREMRRNGRGRRASAGWCKNELNVCSPELHVCEPEEDNKGHIRTHDRAFGTWRWKAVREFTHMHKPKGLRRSLLGFIHIVSNVSLNKRKQKQMRQIHEEYRGVNECRM